jgi:uncharacterized protein YqgV (UPF0045/DUF77 family)
MILTVEISMYPFRENYINPIKGFIDRLNEQPDLRIHTTATATLVVGEYDHVMQVFRELLRWSHETYGKAVYVTKFIPGHDPDVLA